MVKPKNLLLGAIFVGGLLVSNAANAITKEEALSIVLSTASAYCAAHPEYQDKNNTCDVILNGIYDYNLDKRIGPKGTLVKIRVSPDGVEDGWRWVYNYAEGDNGKLSLGYSFKIKKPLNPCEVKGWWYKQTGDLTYKAILCKNGKPVVSYEVYTQGYDNDGPIFYLDSPSGGGDAAPLSLYNVAILDHYYCPKLLRIGEALPQSVVEQRAIECTGWSLSHFSCVNNGALAACYPYWDESLSGVAARAIGLR